MYSSIPSSILATIFLDFLLGIHSSTRFEISKEFDDDDMSAPICSSIKCSCDYRSKISSCSGLVFEYLPSFPIWTEVLVLNDNHLTLLRDNSFDGLMRLKKLFMSSSGIEYIESGAFRGLSQLTLLDLSYNRLYFWPSETFKPLIQVRILNLSGNAFDDISVFNKLLPIGPGELDELNLGDNRFVRSSADFVRLPPMRRLELAESKFQSVTGRTVRLRTDSENEANVSVRMDALVQADRLNLFDCAASLDSTFFDSIRNVIDLNVGGNAITDAIVTLSKLNIFPRLENLNVSGLKMDVDVTLWDIYPTNLKSLDVSSLGIKQISFLPLLRRTARLNTLFASNNQIQSVRLNAALSSLRLLRLDGNRLTTFPAFDLGAKFESLEYLDLSDNLITQVDANSLNIFPHLRHLFLSRNRIVHVQPAAFSTCCSSSLSSLDLSHNSIEEIPGVVLTSLRYLNLSSNRLVRIGNGSLSYCIHLESIDISHNPGLVLEKHVFSCGSGQENDKNQVRLRYDNRCVASLSSAWIDELSSLRNLKRVQARDVGLSTVPLPQFSRLLSRVERIDLSENSMETDNWESLASSIPKTTCIRSIDLRRNRLTTLKNLTIFGSNCLEKLDVSENPFDCDCHLESFYAILKSLPRVDKDIYNESIYYCFSPSSYYRYPLYEFVSSSQQCSFYESNQSATAANGLRIILATFLSLVALVLVAVFCRASLATAIRYGFNLRQTMYKPLRVIISGSGSGSDLASPVML